MSQKKFEIGLYSNIENRYGSRLEDYTTIMTVFYYLVSSNVIENIKSL